MNGKCVLYGNEADLQESHVYPKFVIKHTKRTGSNFLRKLIEPNKRFQDGIKLYLLSEIAEQEFSLRDRFIEVCWTTHFDIANVRIGGYKS